MILAPAESKNTPPLASTNPVKTYLYMPCPHSKDSPRFLFANRAGGGEGGENRAVAANTSCSFLPRQRNAMRLQGN